MNALSTQDWSPKQVEFETVANRKTIKRESSTIHKTAERPQIRKLDQLPIVDRSLINYESYHKFIGHAGVKYSMAIQATRGCPYKCFYCDIYKTSVIHFRRSVEHVFNEVKMLADIGVKRFEFIDDIFNVNKKHCIAFFELVLKHNLKLQFFFPTGLKGDLLTKDMIDLMVEAGSIGMNLSLEHASPRMQKVMRKGLDVDKLHENLEYIADKYPRVNLTLNAMHGFPSETEGEALMTLEYIESIKWIDFPYLHNVRIFPGTELEHFALEVGIPKELIEQSQDMSYHENAPTLPFSADFTREVKTRFLREYVLNKERLINRLSYQFENFTEDELNQKYNSYFPNKSVTTVDDVLRLAKINRSELKIGTLFDEKKVMIPELNSRIREQFANKIEVDDDALRLLLIDMSSHFSGDFDSREYNVLEPPYGLLALLTYVNRELEGQVEGKVTKSRIDFDNFQELLKLITEFNPDIIGIRAMTFYMGIFHESIGYLRENGITTPIIVGGPYPTASYVEMLEDRNIDCAVIAEGEETFVELLAATLSNRKQFPGAEVLKEISGLVFFSDSPTNRNEEEIPDLKVN